MKKQYDNWEDAINDFTTDKYDNDFKKIEGLKWLPWVGKNYDATRIFVLGASHYEWIKQGEAGYQDMKDSIERSEFTRGIVAGHGLMRDSSGANTFCNFRKCLLNDDAYSFDAKKELWSSVLFYNLLQEPMIGDTDTIVTDDNEAIAWDVFKKITIMLKPEICIVWGVSVLDYWSKKHDEFKDKYEHKEKVGGSYPRETVINIDRYNVPICVIQHPSRYFDDAIPTQWREYLLTQHKDKLQRIISE